MERTCPSRSGSRSCDPFVRGESGVLIDVHQNQNGEPLVLFLREARVRSPKTALAAVFDTAADLGYDLEATQTIVSEHQVVRSHRMLRPVPGAVVALNDDFEANARFLRITGFGSSRATEYFARFSKYVPTFHRDELIMLAWSESREFPERLIQAAMAMGWREPDGLDEIIRESLISPDLRVRKAATRAANVLGASRSRKSHVDPFADSIAR